jgi:hypothetical protein
MIVKDATGSRSDFFADTSAVFRSNGKTAYKLHDMNPYGGVGVQLHAFLTSAPNGDEWSASHPGHFKGRTGP